MANRHQQSPKMTKEGKIMKKKGPISTRYGLTTELMEAGERIEEIFNSKGIKIPTRQISEDVSWLYSRLQARRDVKYIRVVTKKPDDGHLATVQKTYKGYFVRRVDPSDKTLEVLMLYIVPAYSKT